VSLLMESSLESSTTAQALWSRTRHRHNPRRLQPERPQEFVPMGILLSFSSLTSIIAVRHNYLRRHYHLARTNSASDWNFCAEFAVKWLNLHKSNEVPYLKMRRTGFLKTLGLALIGFSLPARAGTGNRYQDKYTQLVRLSEDISAAPIPTAQMRGDIAAVFDSLFSDVQLADIEGDTESLKILFDAANLTAFYSAQFVHAELMRKCFALLREAGYEDMARGRDVYQSFIAAEAFIQARAFADMYPQLALPPLPAVTETPIGTELQEWLLDRTGANMRGTEFSLPSGPFLIIVSSPHCHFSLASMGAIAKMPDFRKVQPRFKWLMRMERNFDAPWLAKWNAAYPQFRVSIARRASDWRAITHWSTPNFYFFKDGVLAFRFSGWPAEGNGELFDRGMKAAGFRPAV